MNQKGYTVVELLLVALHCAVFAIGIGAGYVIYHFIMKMW